MEAVAVMLWIAAALLVIAGIAGLVLPGVPGAAVLFAGLVLAAWIEDFAYAGAGILSMLAALALLTYAVDFAAGILGARHFGASRRAMAGAVLRANLGGIFRSARTAARPVCRRDHWGIFRTAQSRRGEPCGNWRYYWSGAGRRRQTGFGFCHARRIRGGAFHDVDHGILMRAKIYFKLTQ